MVAQLNKYVDYQMTILGYLVSWGCNKTWALDRFVIEKEAIDRAFEENLGAHDCAYKLAGY